MDVITASFRCVSFTTPTPTPVVVQLKYHNPRLKCTNDKIQIDFNFECKWKCKPYRLHIFEYHRHFATQRCTFHLFKYRWYLYVRFMKHKMIIIISHLVMRLNIVAIPKWSAYETYYEHAYGLVWARKRPQGRRGAHGYFVVLPTVKFDCIACIVYLVINWMTATH